MPYEGLLDALDEEVRRQVRDLHAEAEREEERLLEEARRRIVAERDGALARERRRLGEEAGRAVSRLRLEEAQARLGVKRRILSDLRRQAEGRIRALGDGALLAHLVQELIVDLEPGRLEFEVDPAHVPLLSDYLSREHPEVFSRAIITGVPDLGGGVRVALERGQRLDNSLPSRLAKAWPLLEREIAALLFGEGDGGM